MRTTKLIKKALRGDYITPLTKTEERAADKAATQQDEANRQAAATYAQKAAAFGQPQQSFAWRDNVSKDDAKAIDDIIASKTDGSGGVPVPQITSKAQARVNKETYANNNTRLKALKQFGYSGPLDGKLGGGFRRAEEEATRQGYSWDEGTKSYVQKTPSTVSEPESSNYFTKAATGLLNFFTTPAQAQGTSVNVAGNPQKVEVPASDSKGRAIYLHYPNFEGKMSNALTIGNVDIGKEVSQFFGMKDKLPVGHGETLLVDPNGKVKYVRYGRYTTGTGAVRGSVKGGNWGIYDYPAMKSGETTEQYIQRNKGKYFKGQRMFDDASYGDFEAIDIPDVDYNKALEYATAQANDKNRSEYSINNTCATGATNTIRAGLSTWDKIKSYIPNISGSNAETATGSTLWGWLPGSTNSYARNMRNLGTSTIIHKNGGNLKYIKE